MFPEHLSHIKGAAKLRNLIYPPAQDIDIVTKT